MIDFQGVNHLDLTAYSALTSANLEVTRYTGEDGQPYLNLHVRDNAHPGQTPATGGVGVAREEYGAFASVTLNNGAGGTVTLTQEQLITQYLGTGLIFQGTDGADELIGTQYADTFFGGAGDDTIQGGAGDDRIDAGAGDDILEGGAGNDTYVLTRGTGKARVFDTGSNTIELSADIPLEDLAPRRDGDDLFLRIRGGQTGLVLTGYYSEPQSWQLKLAGGQTVALDPVVSQPDPFAGDDARRDWAEAKSAIRTALEQAFEPRLFNHVPFPGYPFLERSTPLSLPGYAAISTEWIEDTVAHLGNLGPEVDSSGQFVFHRFDPPQISTTITRHGFVDGYVYTPDGFIAPLPDIRQFDIQTVTQQSDAAVINGIGAPSFDEDVVRYIPTFQSRFFADTVTHFSSATLEFAVEHTDVSGSGIVPVSWAASPPGGTGVAILRFTDHAVFEEITGGPGDNYIAASNFFNFGYLSPVFEARYGEYAAFVDAGAGNDTIVGAMVGEGGDGDDVLSAVYGYGGAGNDRVSASYGYGGAGDDVLFVGVLGDGGPGNDVVLGGQTVSGGAGDDLLGAAFDGSVVFGSSDTGEDTVLSGGAVVFADGTKLADVSLSWAIAESVPGLERVPELSQIGRHYELVIDRPTGTVRIVDGFGSLVVGNVQFADGTFTGEQLSALAGPRPPVVLVGTLGDDTLNGSPLDETFQGLDGNDTIFGAEGNDTLNGGSGDDFLIGGTGDDVLRGDSGNDTFADGDGNNVMIGGTGSDTYFFDPGFGASAVYEDGNQPGDVDSIELAFLPSEVFFIHSGNDLILTTGDQSMRVVDAYVDSPRIERYEFTDGTVWDEATVKSVAVTGLIVGTSGDDFLSGTAQDEMIRGRDGNDVLAGGGGNDTLEGGNGMDRYLIDPQAVGVELIGDTGAIDADAFREWYYNSLGIIVAESQQFGGDYVVPADTPTGMALPRGEGGPPIGSIGFDPFRLSSNFAAVLYASLDDLLSSLNAYGIPFNPDDVIQIAPVPELPHIAGNDYAALQPLYDAGIVDMDTVVFAAGITLDNLIVTRSADGATLGFAWGQNGSLRVKLAQPDDPIGTGVEQFEFADGSVHSLSFMLGLATAENPTNQAPVAVPDAVAANEDATAANLVPLLLANDSDPDAGDTLSVSAVDTTGTIGTVAFNAATQTLIYLADAASQDALAAGQTATDSFNYTVADSHGAASTATVTVTVTGVNDAPVAAADSVAVNENATTANLVPLLLANDTDVDTGDTRSITAVNTTGTVGAVAFNAATQSLTYSANAAAQDALAAGQTATDSFSYTVADSQGATSSATVTVTVTGVNDAPVLVTPVADQSATENQAFSFQVPASAFSDVDTGDTLAYSATLASGAALPAWLAFDAATRTFSGAPGQADVGTVGVKVVATDSQGASALDLFDISIAPGFVGTSGDDNLVGTANADTMLGLGGNDTLNGGAGADIMIGGTGNDTYVVDNAGDVVTENAGEGSDTVQSSTAYTLGSNVENLTLTGTTAINGTGNTLDNALTGNSANNTLTGGAGNDTLDGGAGDDTMVGGTGNDTYVVNVATDVVTENANEGTDTVQSSVSYTLGANVENLILTGTTAINGTGNALDNALTGNGAANVLAGGAGNDTYIVSTGDTVTEAANAGTDTVMSDVTWTLGANLENLVLTGTGAINGTGNGLANSITGNSGDNTLSGGTGADTLVGGLGNDTYVVDSVGDVVTENANEGMDLVRSSISYALGANVENLTLTGATAINGTGNALDNALTGNTGNNVLDGGAGNDTLSGGTGADTLIGGTGNDSYTVDNVADVVTENAGEGTDLISSSVTYTLSANVENLTLTGATAINATGNGLDNVLTGNNAINVLDGGAGNDTLSGGAGADTLIGGTGDDTYVVDNVGDVVTENAGEGTDLVQSSVTYTLSANVENLVLTGTGNIGGTGNALANSITGNSGNNALDGGAGADTLAGGLGNDTYVVDNAADLVVENLGEGTDLVQSSVSTTLSANVENLTLTGTAAIDGTGNELNNALTGNAADNVLDGGAGTDTMAGGTGNDSYIVDSTADVVARRATPCLTTWRT